MYTVERQLYESLLGKRVSDSHWSNLKKTAQEADHVITLDEPPELSQNKEITLAEKQTISTVAKDLGFILPQDELKAIAQHSLREIASSLREDSEITSITEIKEAILRFIAKKGERTRREVDTALSEIATAYAAEQLISSRLFASSLANLSKEVKVAKGWNGVRHIVAVELRNNMDLAQAVKVVKVIPSDDVLAPYFALGGTALLITAATISHKLTQHQAVQLLSSLRGIKGKELREDMQEGYALDLHRHTLASTAQVEQEVISREAMTTLASIQSEQEQQLAYLEGQQQGEIDLLEHANKVAELRLSLKEKEEKLKVTAQPKNPKEQLIKKMKGHEGGWLWDVLNSLKPLWLVGNQGSGKTTAGATLALARKVLLEREVNMIVDRHGDSENGELWKLFPEAMLAISADEIGQSLIESIQDWGNRMKMKPKPPVVQVIVDEFTALRELVGEISDTWFKLSCTDTRKGQVQVIGITHNTTNESFPAGTVGTRKAGTILLEKFSANNETPLPRVVIRWGLTDSKGNPLEDEERTWPSWFNIDELNGVT